MHSYSTRVTRCVAAPLPPKLPSLLELRSLGRELVKIRVSKNSAVAGRRIVDAGFPDGGALIIILIRKVGAMLVPAGGTLLEAGDDLLVVGDRAAVADLRAMVDPRAAADRVTPLVNSASGLGVSLHATVQPRRGR
jgi:uncharacterized protein with PhoU and TrkA domain